MAKTLVALYDEVEQAQHAVRELTEKGFRKENISLITSNSSGEYDRYANEMDVGRDHKTVREESGSARAKGAGIGAGAGAGIGGIAGLLIGLGVFTIPGVGPILAAGPIATTLAGAGIGAVAGGLAGALAKLGVPQEEAETYSEGVRRGGTLVLAKVSDEKASQASDILDNHNPVDIDERASSWRNRGWQGYDERAAPYTAEQINEERGHNRNFERDRGESRHHDQGETRIPVTGEEVKVGKRDVRTGGVRARTYITEEPIEEEVHLRDEHVNVERRRVDRPASRQDLDSCKEETIEATEHSEEPVVSKQARVFEEVVISKDVDEHRETIHDTARRTDVDVQEVGARKERDGGFATHRDDFRRHFSNHVSDGNYRYDDYAPVYRYGYDLGKHSRYHNRDWKSIEPEARRDWEQRNPGTWNNSREAVHYAWQKATGKK